MSRLADWLAGRTEGGREREHQLSELTTENQAVLRRAEKVIAEYRRAQVVLGLASDALIDEARRK